MKEGKEEGREGYILGNSNHEVSIVYPGQPPMSNLKRDLAQLDQALEVGMRNNLEEYSRTSISKDTPNK